MNRWGRYCAVAIVGFSASMAAAQPTATFSVDFQGPSKGIPEAFGSGLLITEGDILIPATIIPVPGPLPPPAIMIPGGPNPFLFPDLGIGTYPLYPPGPAPFGVADFIEVDALSYGREWLVDGNPDRSWAFSVDEFASGIPVLGAFPEVLTEGAIGAMEASADVFVSFPPGAIPALPLPPGFFAGNTLFLDGDGIPSPFGPGPLPLPFPFPGLGLIEPNPPTPGGPGSLPDLGDNLDAHDLDTLDPVFGPIYPVYFSMDSGFPDPLETPSPAGTGPANSGSAAMNGFVGGDVLVTAAAGAAPFVFAPAAALGLDLIAGPDSDDLDALALAENGTGVFEPSTAPMDWVGGITDMLLFSVRRGSAVIGAPDSCFGAPISESDILSTPLAPAMGGLSPFPCIVLPGEGLALATIRTPAGPFASDDLDALDILRDCDFDGLPDHYGVLYGVNTDCNGNFSPDMCDIFDGISLDCNTNGTPDECDIASGISPDVNTNGVPDECEDFTPPSAVAAVSRRSHGLAGSFDVDVSSGCAVECRSGGPQLVIVDFDEAIIAADGSLADNNDVTLSSGTVTGQVVLGGTKLFVVMTGVTDKTCLTMSCGGITDAAGNVVTDTVRIIVLAGDATGDKAVNVADIGFVAGQSSQPLTGANFRRDVTADGAINVADIGFTSGRSGTSATCAGCP